MDSTTGTGTVYFYAPPPGSSGEAIYNSSINGNSTTVSLPSDGDYVTRVYQMGNERTLERHPVFVSTFLFSDAERFLTPFRHQ